MKYSNSFITIRKVHIHSALSHECKRVSLREIHSSFIHDTMAEFIPLFHSQHERRDTCMYVWEDKTMFITTTKHNTHKKLFIFRKKPADIKAKAHLSSRCSTSQHTKLHSHCICNKNDD